MNYSLEMITTIAAIDALLLQAGENKENQERRRRNTTELEAVNTLLGTYSAAYDALPEGKNKLTIYL